MLIGKFKHSIDSKNRIYIPNKFINDLGTKCVLSQDIADNCLNLYPLKIWLEFAADMDNKLPKIKMRKARQKIFQNADEVELDSQNRIVLTQEICREVGIAGEKEAIITGNYSHIQIWSVEEWTKFNKEMKNEETQKKIIDAFEEMGL